MNLFAYLLLEIFIDFLRFTTKILSNTQLDSLLQVELYQFQTT